MKIVLVIPVYNKPQITHQCLTSIFKYSKENPKFETLAIDDGSSQMTRYCLKSYPVEIIRNQENKGYLYSTNKGIQHALDDMLATHVILMNNDTELHGDWLANLVKYASLYDILGYYGRMYMGPSKHKKGHFLEFSCVMIKRKVFEKIGLLDDRFPGGYYSDDDFCLRAMCTGYRVGQINRGEPQRVEHHPGGTAGRLRKINILKAYKVFRKKWDPLTRNPIVELYLRKYAWLADKKCWGDMARVKALREKYKSR